MESALCLLKEVKDNTSAELPLLFVIVHLKNLLKGGGIDVVAQLRQTDRAFLALEMDNKSAHMIALQARMERDGGAGRQTAASDDGGGESDCTAKRTRASLVGAGILVVVTEGFSEVGGGR